MIFKTIRFKFFKINILRILTFPLLRNSKYNMKYLSIVFEVIKAYIGRYNCNCNKKTKFLKINVLDINKNINFLLHDDLKVFYDVVIIWLKQCEKIRNCVYANCN